MARAKEPKKNAPEEPEKKEVPENLVPWLEDHPEGPNYKHGAHSKHVRKRYSDKRTTEGRQLQAIMDDLAADLGGQSEITAAQRLLLDNIRSKLIVVLQISKYADRQESLINDKGELIPCLGRNYTSYSEALRRDLEALFSIKRKPDSMSYERAMRTLQQGEEGAGGGEVK